ncbi:Uncharacterised protein [uncultured archaeon]|nr:Uncharacterised protein [uncultured archaeon]
MARLHMKLDKDNVYPSGHHHNKIMKGVEEHKLKRMNKDDVGYSFTFKR